MFELFRTKNTNYKDDLLSGLTVALALVPEAIAFAFAAGVDPLVGLWAAVFMGFITSTCGGRPGMISGATGAIAVVAGKAVQHGDALGGGLGLQYLFAVIMIAGTIQILFGVLKLGRFIRLVPHPVMIGFVNGLAIVILMAQFPSFKDLNTSEWLSGQPLAIMVGLVALTMVTIQFFPKITKAVPSSLVAIGSVGVIAFLFFKDSATVSDILAQSPSNPEGKLSGSFPLAHLPTGIAWATEWPFLLKTAFIVSMVGIIESLMTLHTWSRQSRVRCPRWSEFPLRTLRRHGRLCDDRTISHQHQIRRAGTPFGHCRRSRPSNLHNGCGTRNRSHPDRRPSGRYVHGRDRHLRMVLLKHLRQGSFFRDYRHRSGNHYHRDHA